MSLASDFQASPIWQKILLALLALFLIIGLLKNYVIGDKPDQINQTKRKINRLAREIKSQESVAAEYDLTQRKYDEMQAGLGDKLPSVKGVMANMGYLIAQGAASNINFTLVQPEPLLDRSNFWEIPLALKVQGELIPLAQFLKRIETSKQKSKISKLEIQHVNQDIYEASLDLILLASKSGTSSADAVPEIIIPTPVVTKPSVSPKKPVDTEPKWQINGFWDGTQQGVFIDNKLIKVGQTIYGYQLKAINSREGRITMVNNGKIKILKLKGL